LSDQPIALALAPKGFSPNNLLYVRAFAEAWPDPQIVPQAVGQLPWGHNLVLLTRMKQAEQRLAYAQAAIEQIERELQGGQA
jgi:predicted nuclease of restriction endonuclease-like (RecB) superfamily